MRGKKTVKRMQRNHDRAKKQAPFNIVSLMDIFTILVFFLLVNASDPTVLPNAKGIEMPQSMAEKKPRVSVVLMLSQDDISLQGEKVVSSDNITGNKKSEVQKLQIALQEEILKVHADIKEGEKKEITIMGDKSVPFSLIKQVMQICSSAGFEQISLSVIQRESTQAS
ncbi:MAG: ExbD/TolR family protein [Gammaproteobacteria bacterium]